MLMSSSEIFGGEFILYPHTKILIFCSSLDIDLSHGAKAKKKPCSFLWRTAVEQKRKKNVCGRFLLFLTARAGRRLAPSTMGNLSKV